MKFYKKFILLLLFLLPLFLIVTKQTFATACNATGDGTWGGTDTARALQAVLAQPLR